jgi:hypothetical protein
MCNILNWLSGSVWHHLGHVGPAFQPGFFMPSHGHVMTLSFLVPISHDDVIDQKYFSDEFCKVKLKVMRLIKSIGFMLFAIWVNSASAQPQEADIIYTSPEPLTKTMLRQHAQLVQDLLDVKYSPEQLATHHRLIKNYWVKGDYNGITSVKGNISFYAELKQLSAEAYRANIQSMRPALILNLMEDAAKREDSKWFLETYYAAHPPLIKEGIPFIRETADALLDGEYFINKTLKGKSVARITTEQRELAYVELARQWQQFDADTRKQIMTGASQMSLVFYRWNQLSAAERAGVKMKYVGENYLSPAERNALQQASLAGRSNPTSHLGLIGNELEQMKKTTDLIMGRGIRWDPSRNRYVQDGGIVTEYW